MSGDDNWRAEAIAPENAVQGRGTDEPTATSSVAREWTPEFEGQRPPFEPGNEAAVKHGARSRRKVEEVAARIDADLLSRAPWVRDYPEALRAYGRAEAVARMLFNDIARAGAYDSGGQFRASIVAKWATAENSAARQREALGLTPRSEAEVARDRAVAASTSIDVVGELIRQGRATRAHQQGSTATAASDDASEPEAHPREPNGGAA